MLRKNPGGVQGDHVCVCVCVGNQTRASCVQGEVCFSAVFNEGTICMTSALCDRTPVRHSDMSAINSSMFNEMG